MEVIKQVDVLVHSDWCLGLRWARDSGEYRDVRQAWDDRIEAIAEDAQTALLHLPAEDPDLLVRGIKGGEDATIAGDSGCRVIKVRNMVGSRSVSACWEPGREGVLMKRLREKGVVWGEDVIAVVYGEYLGDAPGDGCVRQVASALEGLNCFKEVVIDSEYCVSKEICREVLGFDF